MRKPPADQIRPASRRLVAILALTLAACGGPAASEAPAPESAPEETAPGVVTGEPDAPAPTQPEARPEPEARAEPVRDPDDGDGAAGRSSPPPRTRGEAPGAEPVDTAETPAPEEPADNGGDGTEREAEPGEGASSPGEPGKGVEPGERSPPPDPEPASPPVLTGGPVTIRDDALLPRQRIVAFYGNPASTRMGILGEVPPAEMLARLDREVEAWRRADPSLPVKPALHLITTMAAGDPGRDGLYRIRLSDRRIAEVKEWADRRDALLFLDIQPGRSTVARELPRLREWLIDPGVHLALDPEWNMGPEGFPGRVIGSMSAEEINHAIRFLAGIVEEHDLPPKVLVVHRFTQRMVRGATEIVQDPRVQVVLHMDGWGPPAQKLNTYRTIVAPEAEQFLGFKLFYKNDRKGGSRMLTPGEILALRPVPVYIQYQ